MAADSRPRSLRLGVWVAVAAGLLGLAVFGGVRYLFFGLDEPTPWDKPARLVDGQIELTYDGRECRDQVDVTVEENSEQVVITVTERVRTLVCRDEEVTSYDVSVELDEPLGDRVLVDGACGLGQFTNDERCDSESDRIAG
ncbi:hypothetical protein [Nocardioides sp.]|uniref:hypothetical protein n=1 Tax=Nocardioides sp. TaxID=35761 RepID=UPI002B26561A|nr:hypothetical protein [Nocardioides sp.]